ncbi:MAG: NAD(P)-dependent oxidoreductase [Gammaproteobacteria bacterium WSBS_2016_MAG_OTU1]
MKVGFIGLGTMGGAAAKNLLRGGFSLVVHDIKREKADVLLEGGAIWADSPAAVAAACDIVVTMVFGPRELEQVIRGDNGLLAGGMKERGWIDMTTGSPKFTREVAADIVNAGGWAVDAPVTGSVDAAIRGDMIMFVGGEEAAITQAEPVLQAMGEPRRVGDIGAGQVAKLTNNLIWKINAAAIGEAMVAAKKAGMDPEVWWQAMQGGAADTFVLRHDVPSIFAGHYDPSFPLALCMKDWGLIDDFLQQMGTRNEVAVAAMARFAEARTRYGEGAGEMTVCKLIEEDANTFLQTSGDWTPPWEVKHDDDK